LNDEEWSCRFHDGDEQYAAPEVIQKGLDTQCRRIAVAVSAENPPRGPARISASRYGAQVVAVAAMRFASNTEKWR
jgi:hypothetical protein